MTRSLGDVEYDYISRLVKGEACGVRGIGAKELDKETDGVRLVDYDRFKREESNSKRKREEQEEFDIDSRPKKRVRL